MSVPFLFVALDDISYVFNVWTRQAPDISEVVHKDFGYKINLDAVALRGLKGSVGLIRSFHPGREIFVDLKMWNGGRTMASIVNQCAELGVDYVNVYALADGEIKKAIEAISGSNTKVLGVTVLTHYTEVYCQKHFRRTHAETVRHLSETALEAGCHGIILPGTALKAVQDLKTIKLCPGIRPSWYKDSRHEEEVTPAQAREWDADIVVCGSPIMKDTDPPGALRRILAELDSNPES